MTPWQFIITDDAKIKEILVRQHIPIAKPVPPNDIVIATCCDNGIFWMIIRFYQAGDEGFVAVGLHENSPAEDRKKFINAILEHFTSIAKESGMDAWEHSTFTEVKPLEMS